MEAKSRERERLKTLEETMKKFTATHEQAIARERAETEEKVAELRQVYETHALEIQEYEAKILRMEMSHRSELAKAKQSWDAANNKERNEKYSNERSVEYDSLKR